MQFHKAYIFASFIMLLLLFGACKKVINVNLNSTNPRYVVQGSITDQPGPYTISVTKTINFDQDNDFPTVSGAVVVIADATAGEVDTLKELTPGNYSTSIIKGVSGHTYTMYVNTAGNIFSASGTMPAPVQLDSLYTQPSPFGNDPELVPLYTDPVATGNYYYFQVVRNDTLTSDIYIRNDELLNGQIIRQPLNGSSLISGDSVTVYLECVDSAIYQYYYTLRQTEEQNVATPANPLSNITGGALGYFSAHTVSKKSILVH